ncbi:hypothetical protein HNR42_001972 [Deinobacterium chartae]|uniref:HD/PDEase domain-containing protein n=1 Tax=Deinobacterium chartae TaxID=521158 RepID=A0A841I2G9_9DEIO|nr:HD domain-containing protein [Deinobacterium chartae]MBB6098538.1 hypothetical protein [Deinobacterium chartae]
MSTSRIKDVLEGLISFDGLEYLSKDALVRVIDTPEFQRLRHVQQLGLASFVYPGATHTRLSHSLGAFSGAVRVLAQLRARGCDMDPDWQAATVLAALLHDVGHGPFSHAFEAVTGRDGARGNHEDYTLRLLEVGPQLRPALDAVAPDMSARVQALISKRLKTEDPDHGFLVDLISGPLDVDRGDYLRRDAYFTGVHYGLFDRDWLISALDVSQEWDAAGRRVRSALLFEEKGLPSVEAYLIGRYHMFRQVYFHKTKRFFEKALEVVSKLVQERGQPGGVWIEEMLAEVRVRDLDLETYLELTDAAYLEAIRVWRRQGGGVGRLASAIWNREPYRTIDVTDLPVPSLAAGEDPVTEAVKAYFERAGLDHRALVLFDEATDTTLKPENYRELRVRSGGGRTQTLVQYLAGGREQIRDRGLSSRSLLLEVLSASYRARRIFVDAAHYPQVRRIVDRLRAELTHGEGA